MKPMQRYIHYLKLILLQLFAVYYIAILSIGYLSGGTTTSAYFSDELSKHLTLKSEIEWGKSSLEYVNGTTELTCSTISAAFRNKQGAGPMNTILRFGIYIDKNQKEGDVLVTKDEIPKRLAPGESYNIQYDLSKYGPGKYIIRVYQEQGHPGNSMPPSDSVQYDGKCSSVEQRIQKSSNLEDNTKNSESTKNTKEETKKNTVSDQVEKPIKEVDQEGNKDISNTANDEQESKEEVNEEIKQKIQEETTEETTEETKTENRDKAQNQNKANTNSYEDKGGNEN
ncbi:hypothetical protein [Fictibacillus sp. KU28468]|uniref:hypothetical protein n=1 Tax=Fictibacillus sp. KU28468 TaxID=2991053 RepID=UPI00223D44DF|nr:hypothetical protein [Fictibacillus sp. KU28468]UZJ80075.1 hypothetical protein OKX00_06305 [Fictibacillus sp. KU28468]